VKLGSKLDGCGLGVDAGFGRRAAAKAMAADEARSAVERIVRAHAGERPPGSRPRQRHCRPCERRDPPASGGAPMLAAMAAAVASTRGLAKAYGAGRSRRAVLAGVDLDLAAGELVAVVGRSGSGKSTLLHLLGGLERPDAGEIDVGGVRVDRADERGLTELRRRRVGFVFQFFHLIPELTGAENVMLPARLAGVGAAAEARAVALIDRLGVAEASARLPGVLSGGEQQRLAVARALVNDPALVLADEPTGNLDEESGHEVLRLLRSLADEGRSVLLVTHEPEAAAIADRVLHLRQGRLKA
jgi:ABC-type lipoprotein export system ATPase subunit